MTFWSGVGKGFKAIGHFFVDFVVKLPTIINAGEVAVAQVPTLVTDIGTLLNAVKNLVSIAVSDAKPIIAALVSLGEAIFAAVAAGLTNVAADENVVVQTGSLVTAIKNDYPAFANFASALNDLVTAYDNVADKIRTALAAVEKAA